MATQMKIIGITGAFGSGKSTAAGILQDLGYHKISLSSFLEEELQNQKKEITRQSLQDLGNLWREKYGRGVLFEKALECAEKNKWQQVVIEGFRNTEEVLLLRKRGSVLLSLIVDRATRFVRLKSLQRREHLTEELFEKLDNRDLGIGEKDSGLQGAICIAMADIFIENNGSLSDLEKKISSIVTIYE